MCGIIGSFGAPGGKAFVDSGLKQMKERGMDGFSIHSEEDNFLGHRLHSIVHTLKQPLVLNHHAFAANCEIYNWKTLCSKYKIKARNDSELLFKLLLKKGVSALSEVKGVYAFALWGGGKVVIARDIIGVKPLFYSTSDGFRFASEKKCLVDGEELNPRTIMTYDIASGKVSTKVRSFFKKEPVVKKDASGKLHSLLSDAVSIRVPERPFGLLLSGGLDSVLIAKLLVELGCEFTCYTAAVSEESDDLVWAKKAAEHLGLELKYSIVDLSDVEKYLTKVVPLIEDSNVVKVGVALPLFAACELARKDGKKVIFAGSGADEVFAGYARYKQSASVNKDCYSDVLKIYERNTYRDDVITMHNNLELRVPFLDKDVVAYGLRVSSDQKIKDGVEKGILRKIASTSGIPQMFASRKKKAAQYGSGFDKVISKLAKQSKLTKSAYLDTFYERPNVKLGALVSSGKDGLYAAYTMQKQNYSIGCLITLKSTNPDSYMFHTPNVHLAELQAEAMGIPIIVQSTSGEKEKELKDLEKALVKAKKLGCSGIVSGALYSNYQRERIEKICDKLGLKIFSPLWHIDQEQEMRSLLKEGFEIWLSSVAADGLDKSWVGRTITSKDVDKLVVLHKKVGLNVAGEGGEFESLVLDCPMFAKRIVVEDFTVREESKHVAKLVVKKAELARK